MRGRWRDYNENWTVTMAKIMAQMVPQDQGQERGRSQKDACGLRMTPE